MSVVPNRVTRHLRIPDERDDLDPERTEVDAHVVAVPSDLQDAKVDQSLQPNLIAYAWNEHVDDVQDEHRCRPRGGPEPREVDPQGPAEHLVSTDRDIGLEGRSQRAGVGLDPDPRSRGLDLQGGGRAVRGIAAPGLNRNRRSVRGIRAAAADQPARIGADVGADHPGGHASVRFAVTDLNDADRAGRGVATANLGEPRPTVTSGSRRCFRSLSSSSPPRRRPAYPRQPAPDRPSPDRPGRPRPTDRSCYRLTAQVRARLSARAPYRHLLRRQSLPRIGQRTWRQLRLRCCGDQQERRQREDDAAYARSQHFQSASSPSPLCPPALGRNTKETDQTPRQIRLIRGIRLPIRGIRTPATASLAGA